MEEVLFQKLYFIAIASLVQLFIGKPKSGLLIFATFNISSERFIPCLPAVGLSLVLLILSKLKVVPTPVVVCFMRVKLVASKLLTK